jgi:hypothetical protein
MAGTMPGIASKTTQRIVSTPRFAAMSDPELLTRMGGGDVAAWGEFSQRFRPAMEAFARRVGIPVWDWGVCITEVLDDEALRLAGPSVARPEHCSAYLVRAMYHRYLRLKRARDCQERHYSAASDDFGGERVVGVLCSEHAVRASEGLLGELDGDGIAYGAVAALGRAIEAELSEEERLIVAWLGQGVAHRQIADWLGTTYDATTKRIWRLCRRIRDTMPRHVARFNADDRREVERFFRRAAPAASASVESKSVSHAQVTQGIPPHGRHGRSDEASMA